MKRVFLSYARENDDAAVRIGNWLRDQRVDPVRWRDAEHTGISFVREIEQAIAAADLFLVLLSPDYLLSPWCRRERDLAFLHESGLGGRQRFVHVLEVVETAYATSGFLRDHRVLDATDPLTPAKLDAIASSLELSGSDPPAAGSDPRPGLPSPIFRNRFDELDRVLGALTVAGGKDLWVVVSPPQMGKSWLIDRLQQEIVTRDPQWSVTLLDVRDVPLTVRSNATAVVGALLGVKVDRLAGDGPVSVQDLRHLASAVSDRRQQLYLLDSAELLEVNCAAYVRSALTAVYRRVKHSGSRETRFCVLVGTRRHDEWRGLGHDARVGERFESILLSEFSEAVFCDALSELDSRMDDERQKEYARRLHELSQGLPMLLVRSMQWAVRTGFRDIDDSDGDAAFDEVSRPYISDYLLAPESLLPSPVTHPREALDVLERALRALVPYRLLTQSHLRFHLNDDPEFSAALATARWSQTDLWEAIGRTSLVEQSGYELWQVIEEPIRRLLYRYFYRTPAGQLDAHTVARTFYNGWEGRLSLGKEAPIVLVERLWHEASRMVLRQPDEVPYLLPAVASELAQDLADSPIYAAAEFLDFALHRLRDDTEFQQLLSRYDGLFEEIAKSVAQSIGGSL